MARGRRFLHDLRGDCRIPDGLPERSGFIWRLTVMYLRWINKHDRMDDLPETFNENMQKIEQAMTDLQFEIAHIKDDIEHLKILAREDGGDE